MANLTQPPPCDQALMVRALNILLRGGTPTALFEIRARSGKKLWSGYYNASRGSGRLHDIKQATQNTVDLGALHTYVSLNPVTAEVIADRKSALPADQERRYHKLKQAPKQTTRDTEIIERLWLLLDVDPGPPPVPTSSPTRSAKRPGCGRTPSAGF